MRSFNRQHISSSKARTIFICHISHNRKIEQNTMAPGITNPSSTLIQRTEQNAQAFSNPQKPEIVRAPVLQRQMTSLGRFALRSQTVENPSIITFFVAFDHESEEDFTAEELQSMWGERVMGYHERFRCQVSKDNDRLFEVCSVYSLFFV